MSERPLGSARREGSARRRAARKRAASGAEADLRALLEEAARRLARALGEGRVAVWRRGIDGAWQPLGAAPEPGPAAVSGALEALGRLRRATDLGGERKPEALRTLATRSGLPAAVPVRAGGGELAALLFAGGEADAPGRVRPRTLAALDAEARRLEPAVVAAGALARLERLDAGIRRLDRLAALGDLLAEIAHEVRNPLVSVKTFLQLLPQRLDDPEFRSRFRDVVADEVGRIERLLEVVLEHARPEPVAGAGQASEVGAAVDSVLRLVGQRALERGVTLGSELGGDALCVSLSEDALRQVLLNLVLNAIDATPAGGRVEIRARQAGRRVELTVCDQGPGVAAELRERIFEPFFSTKPDRPGGLGLAISRRMVEDARGSIRVADARGGGAAFHLLLPDVRKRPEAAPRRKPDASEA